MSDSRPKKLTKPTERELFLNAWQTYNETGTASVACDKCGTIIEFVHWPPGPGIGFTYGCKCGKYTGVLKGL